LSFAFIALQSQEQQKENIDYNNWSIDFEVNKPSRNLTLGVQSEWFEFFFKTLEHAIC
jgi:hypothetical protein